MSTTAINPLVSATLPVPLQRDEQGTIRVGDSRLTLETLIYTYLEGASPEIMAQECFPGLALADAYAIIAFYLQNQPGVDVYLATQSARAQEARARAVQWAGRHRANPEAI